MNLADILTAERTRILDNVNSKKRALEYLSEILSEATPYLTATEIFTALIARERLGSTGLGDGVAIPHGRLKGLDKCVGAVIRLPGDGVPFEAPDGKPVNILFGLLVPQESTELHLNVLRTLAEMFTDETHLTRLREASSDSELYRIMLEQAATAQAE